MGNAALLIKRGQLHHTHRDWPAALRDFDRAAEIDPNAYVVHLRRGETLLESGRTEDANRLWISFFNSTVTMRRLTYCARGRWHSLARLTKR